MHDLAYLVPDSAKAWLEGHGDGRFESYERYYRRALKHAIEELSVEDVNAQYEAYAQNQARKAVVKVGNYLVIITAIWFGLYLIGKVIVSTSDVAPKTTGALLLAAIVARKVFQRRHRAASKK